MMYEIEGVECKKDLNCLAKIRFENVKHREMTDDIEKYRKKVHEMIVCDRVLLKYSEVGDEAVDGKSDTEKVC